MARKSRQDWLEVGIAVLATQGADALTIDRIADQLGVTKGSFYHHFRSQAEYRDSLLAFWEQEGMAAVDRVPGTPAEALAVLDRIVGSSPIGTHAYDPGMAIRFWATREPAVAAFVERVDARRLAYAEELVGVIVGDRDRARFLGRMLYALVLGSGHMLPPAGHDEMLAFYEAFKRSLLTDGGAGA